MIDSFSTHRHLHRHRRGVALLLVMIGLVVCTLLTAGFLSSQGTAIGIARNERDAEACRFLAQSGIDICFSLVRNKSGWRESMTPGTWLNKYAIGNGTITVTATSANGSNSFATDPTQAVIFHSTGYCNNRNFSLTGTIGPTGGGTVFRGGNFFQGNVILGNNDLLTVAIIDSYNSAVAAYNSLLPGGNALFGTNSTTTGALTISFPSTFKGSFAAGPTANLSTVVNLIAGLLGQLLGGPSSVTASTELRTPGSIIPPNFATQVSNGPYSQSSGSHSLVPGVYDSFTLTNTSAPVTTLMNGSFEILNNMNVPTATTVTVAAGANVLLLVNGNTTISGNIVVPSTSTLAIYFNGSFNATGAKINNGGGTSNLLLLGLSTGGSVQLTSSTIMSGAIYAPQSSITLQTGTPKLYGAVVAHDLTVKNTAQFHYDQALQTLRVDNITGGSAPPGTADYAYSIAGS